MKRHARGCSYDPYDMGPNPMSDRCDCGFEEFKTLSAERDRYRAALEKIASAKSVVPGDTVDIARKALKD